MERIHENRYIYRKNSGYQLKKHRNGKQEYYGSYPTLEDARKKRDELEKMDWDTNRVKVNIQHHQNTGEDKYIHAQSNGKTWVIQYRTRYYGQYSSLEEARAKRDELMLNDWDTSKVRIPVKRRPRNNPDKYITKESGGYTIQKWHRTSDGGRELARYDYGIKSIKEARKIRDWWIEHNWDWGEI